MNTVKKSIKSDLKRLDAMRDEDIDYSEIPEFDEEFLEKAVLINSGDIKMLQDAITEGLKSGISDKSFDEIIAEARAEMKPKQPKK
jgi:uncharacterized protein (DUF305 family)